MRAGATAGRLTVLTTVEISTSLSSMSPRIATRFSGSRARNGRRSTRSSPAPVCSQTICDCENPPLPAATRAAAAVDLSRRLKALADPTRLEIVSRLLAAREPVCVCDLVAGFDLGQPTISHHLKRLRQAGLVRAQRRGTWVYYRAEPATLEEVRSRLEAI